MGGGRRLLALCLHSDKGICRFLEITVEAGQFYFHRRLSLLGSSPVFSGLRHTAPGENSDGAGVARLGVQGGVFVSAPGARRLGAPFPEAKTGHKSSQLPGRLLLVYLLGVTLRQRLHTGPGH